jgi:hemoglobin
MRTVRALGSLVAVAILVAGVVAPTAARAQSGDSLYKRLGGDDAIAAVVDDFTGRMIADPQLKRFFDPFSIDSKGRNGQHLVDQVCAAAGGPCVYTGRTMKVSHTGIGITETHWTGFVKHLSATLDEFKVPDRETRDVLGFIGSGSVKGDIVEKP